MYPQLYTDCCYQISLIRCAEFWVEAFILPPAYWVFPSLEQQLQNLCHLFLRLPEFWTKATKVILPLTTLTESQINDIRNLYQRSEHSRGKNRGYWIFTLSRLAQSETKLLLKQTPDTILLTMPGRHYPSLLQSFGSWLSPCRWRVACRQHAGIRGWQPSYSISELMTSTDKTSSETRCQQIPIFYDLDNW